MIAKDFIGGCTSKKGVQRFRCIAFLLLKRFHYMVGDIPEYTITELPEGYVENQEERIATQIQVSILYQSDTGYPITLHYIYLQQGAASQFVLDSTDDVVIDTVNGYEAYIFVAADQENDSNAITWIDTQSNIQFTVQAQMSTDDLVHMAESVSLVNSPKIE